MKTRLTSFFLFLCLTWAGAAPIELTNPSLAQLPGIQSALGLNATVAVRRPGSAVQRSFWRASADTDAARMAALALAIATVEPGDVVELVTGRFAVTAPLTTLTDEEGWTIAFNDGSALVYDDPADACDDCNLFTGTRNIVNFGAVSTPEGGTPVDCTPAIQSAWNALPLYPDGANVYTLGSGRKLRSGNVSAPDGTYWLGGPVIYSPTTKFIGGSMRGTIFKIMNGAANGAGSEVIFMKWDYPVAPLNPNNLFGSYFENMILSCPRPDLNTRASGWSVGGGQGTGGRAVIVTNFHQRNLIAWGGIFTDCWFPEVVRGPSVDAVMGSSFNFLSVEHANAGGNLDTAGTYDATGVFWAATGRRFPAARFNGGHYSANFISGEQGYAVPVPPAEVGVSLDQTVVELINVLSYTVGGMAYGVTLGATRNDLMLRVTGTSENVRVGEINGNVNGGSAYDVGTLVYDDSIKSPNGLASPSLGNPYILGDVRGSYSQKSGGFVPGKDIFNAFSGINTFAGQSYFSGGFDGTRGAGVQVGSNDGSGRVMLTNGNAAGRWEWDNGGTEGGTPQLRWFYGGVDLPMTLSSGGNLALTGRVKAVIPNYADADAADTDAGLLSGQLYRIGGGRAVYQKP